MNSPDSVGVPSIAAPSLYIPGGNPLIVQVYGEIPQVTEKEVSVTGVPSVNCRLLISMAGWEAYVTADPCDAGPLELATAAALP